MSFLKMCFSFSSANLIKKIFQKKDYEHCQPVTSAAQKRRCKPGTKRASSTRKGVSKFDKRKRTKMSKTRSQSQEQDDLEEEARLACVVIENVEADIPINQPVDSSTPRKKVSTVTNKSVSSPRRYTYLCSRCGKDMRNRSQLNLHLKNVHNEGNEDIGILCEQCGKRVDFDHELELHRKFLCKKVLRNSPCRVCKLSFRSRHELVNHPCTRSATKPFFCSEADCNWSGKGFKDLTEHVTRHMGIKPFLCTTCGRAFAAKKDMDSHADVHRDSKDFQCQECHLSYRSERSLKRHMIMHKFKDRFKCRECSYSSALRSSFNNHMLKHKKRAYICHMCKKSLRSEKSLKQHVQNRHTFNRIFTCRYCDFNTDDGPRFSSHMRKHKHLKNQSQAETEQSLDVTSNILSVTSSSPVCVATATIDISTTSLSVPLPSSSMMTLAAAAISYEDVDQNADTLMASYVAATDTTEITVMTSEVSSGGLMLDNVDIPPGSESLPTCSTSILSMPPLMSDAMPNMDSEQWNNNP